MDEDGDLQDGFVVGVELDEDTIKRLDRIANAETDWQALKEARPWLTPWSFFLFVCDEVKRSARRWKRRWMSHGPS